MVASSFLWIATFVLVPAYLQEAAGLQQSEKQEGNHVVRKFSSVNAAGAIISTAPHSGAVRREGVSQAVHQKGPVEQNPRKGHAKVQALNEARNTVVREASETAPNNTFILKLSERAAAIGKSTEGFLHAIYGSFKAVHAMCGSFEASLLKKGGTERVFDHHHKLSPGHLDPSAKPPNTGNYTIFNPASTRRLFAKVTNPSHHHQHGQGQQQKHQAHQGHHDYQEEEDQEHQKHQQQNTTMMQTSSTTIQPGSLEEEQWSHGFGARKGYEDKFAQDEMWQVVRGEDGLYNITNIASKRMLFAKNLDHYIPGGREFSIAVGPSRFLGACEINQCWYEGLIQHESQTKWEIARISQDSHHYEIKHHLTGRKLYADDVVTFIGPHEWWKGFGAASDEQVQDGFMPLDISWEEATEWQFDRLSHGELHVHFGDKP